MSKLTIIKKIYASLWIWMSARFVNLFLYHIAQHSAIHTEARLLVQHLCDTEQRNSISGALIDCDNARRLLATKSFGPLYALEHTFYDIVIGTFRAATQEVASLAKAVGLLATCMFTVAFVTHAIWARYTQLRTEQKMYNEHFLQALMYRGKHHELLSAQPAPKRLGFANHDDEDAVSKFD